MQFKNKEFSGTINSFINKMYHFLCEPLNFDYLERDSKLCRSDNGIGTYFLPNCTHPIPAYNLVVSRG